MSDFWLGWTVAKPKRTNGWMNRMRGQCPSYFCSNDPLLALLLFLVSGCRSLAKARFDRGLTTSSRIPRHPFLFSSNSFLLRFPSAEFSTSWKDIDYSPIFRKFLLTSVPSTDSNLIKLVYLFKFLLKHDLVLKPLEEETNFLKVYNFTYSYQ